MRVLSNSFTALVLGVVLVFRVLNFLLKCLAWTFEKIGLALLWLVELAFGDPLERYGLGAGPRSLRDWLEVSFFWLAVYFLVRAIWFPPAFGS